MPDFKKIYSFDVFDTLLTRCYIKPSDIFHSIGKDLHLRGLTKMSVDKWVETRIKAEENARIASSFEEITLDEIYDFFGSSSIDESMYKSQMMEVEIEHELKNLFCIRYHANIVKDLREKGNKVIFISDMYLPKSVIKEALQKNGIGCEDDELYVSSEYRVTKHTGNLYKKVLQELKTEPANLVHTGDNIQSDFRIPQSLGIESNHFSKFAINKREQLVLNDKGLPYNFKSIIASCTRLTALNNHYDDIHKDQIVKISSTVIGPVLFGFVLWTLLEAKKMGLTRLYFISRDGQILLGIANEINKVLDTGINCSYFYGSRQALHLPAVEKEGLKDLDWLYDDTTFLSIELLLDRVDVQPLELYKYLSEWGFPENSWKRNLNRPERKMIREALNDSTHFQQLVISKAEDARCVLVDYLKQEGISSDSKMAFVDIGWNGRLQRSISKVMKIAGIRPDNGVNGFYFGLIQRLRAFADDSLNAYYYDAEMGLQPYYDTSILEKFVEATHGSVLKYRKETGIILPVLKGKENTNALEWGLDVQQSTIINFATNLSKHLKGGDGEELNSYSNWRKLSEILITDFCLNPTIQESNVFGSRTFSEGQNDSTHRNLVKPLSLRNCFTVFIDGTQNYYNGLWVSGSLMLTKKGRFFKKIKKIKGEAARLLKGNKNR